ncbi:MAG: hypothetical protein R2733_17685 [Acidimicrobiales bacterium]
MLVSPGLHGVEDGVKRGTQRRESVRDCGVAALIDVHYLLDEAIGDEPVKTLVKDLAGNRPQTAAELTVTDRAVVQAGDDRESPLSAQDRSERAELAGFPARP